MGAEKMPEAAIMEANSEMEKMMVGEFASM